MAFLVAFDASPWRVVIEDDDRVCHAYLLDPTHIVSDVWLWNRIPPADDPEWSSAGPERQPPFLNPVPFVDAASKGVLDTDQADIDVRWADIPAGVVATIFVRGRAFAVLRNDRKPGQSALAIVGGPLAEPLPR